MSFADSPSGMFPHFLQVFCNARLRFGKSRWAASVENLIFSYMKQQPPRSPRASLRLFVVLLCSLPFASCSLFFVPCFFPGFVLDPQRAGGFTMIGVLCLSLIVRDSPLAGVPLFFGLQ